jgi:IS1 family transposase
MVRLTFLIYHLQEVKERLENAGHVSLNWLPPELNIPHWLWELMQRVAFNIVHATVGVRNLLLFLYLYTCSHSLSPTCTLTHTHLIYTQEDAASGVFSKDYVHTHRNDRYRLPNHCHRRQALLSDQNVANFLSNPIPAPPPQFLAPPAVPERVVAGIARRRGNLGINLFILILSFAILYLAVRFQGLNPE